MCQNWWSVGGIENNRWEEKKSAVLTKPKMKSYYDVSPCLSLRQSLFDCIHDSSCFLMVVYHQTQ